MILLVYSNNKLKEQDDYAIANNESYYRLVHHVINVLSDMEIRDRNKELQKQQPPCITKEELKTMFNEYLENQDKKIDASLHNLSENVSNVSIEMNHLSQDIVKLDKNLPLDATLIRMDQVIKLIEALSAAKREDKGSPGTSYGVTSTIIQN